MATTNGHSTYSDTYSDDQHGSGCFFLMLLLGLVVFIVMAVTALIMYDSTVTQPVRDAWKKACTEAGGIPMATVIANGDGRNIICVKMNRVGPDTDRP